MIFEGYRRKQKRHVNELIYTAWHVEAFARQKILPDLKSLLKDENEPQHEQTDAEMLSKVKFINALLGGEVVEK